MDWGHAFAVLATALGVLLLLGLAVIVWVTRRYDIPLRGVVAMGGALVYLVSPLDALPEAVLGPFGLVDDTGVLAGAAFFVYRLVQARRMLREAGVDLHRGRRRSRPG